MKYAKRALVSLILISCLTFTAHAALFTPPFNEHILGDKIDENMPKPFSLYDFNPRLIAHSDFVTNSNLTPAWSYGDWILENNSIKAVKEAEETLMQKSYSYKGEIIGGEYYAFSAKIKETDIKKGTFPRNILSAYKDGKWLLESGNKLKKGDVDENGFYELTQVLKAPEGTNEFKLTAQMDIGVTGTAVFKDFKLYKMTSYPLETVLKRPQYKGLIYGDGIADIDLDIIISEQREVYPLDNMLLKVTLSDSADNIILSSETENISPLMNTTFSSKGLSEGKYYLKATLFDKTTGDLISKREHTLRKVSENFRPDFYVDEDGHAVRNNEKTFFKRIYNSQNDFLKLAKDMENTAVDSVAHNGMSWWFLEPNENRAEAFSYFLKEGQKINLSLMGYWWGNRENNVNMFKSLISEQKDIRAFFKKITDEHKNNELLDGYYIFDEPDPVFYGEEIRWNNEILADFDINHPTYGITDSNYSNYGIFTKMVDIVGIDPYPISGKDTDDVAKIGRSVREITKSFPNRPVYLCLQGFNWDGKYGEGSRGPNYRELRNMAYQAICEGADGLDCYGYHEMFDDPSGKTQEEWWSELTTLYEDIEKYENIILSSEPAPAFSVSGGGEWLNITSRRYNGKSYIFAVNNTKSENVANVKINNAGVAVSDVGDRLNQGYNGYELKFSPLEVKILEITQSEYLSNESELKSIGFFNCRKVFPKRVGEENTLEVSDDYIIINYHAKISDKAKLYINGEEKPLAGKISIKHTDEIRICVVSQDGLSKEETVYKINRRS